MHGQGSRVRTKMPFWLGSMPKRRMNCSRLVRLKRIFSFTRPDAEFDPADDSGVSPQVPSSHGECQRSGIPSDHIEVGALPRTLHIAHGQSLATSRVSTWPGGETMSSSRGPSPYRPVKRNPLSKTPARSRPKSLGPCAPQHVSVHKCYAFKNPELLQNKLPPRRCPTKPHPATVSH